MKKLSYILFLSIFFVFDIVLFAQHKHEYTVSDTTMDGRHEMNSSLTPYAPLARNGSGTSWLPDATQMHAIHQNYGRWLLMIHGSVFVRYTNQNIDRHNRRGGDTFDAPNWVMVMGQRGVGRKGHLMLRGMFSADPITEGANGYKLLFQTGETWKGNPLVDRQHPHDLFMELAAAYSHTFDDHSGVFLYFGLPGEPALGPSAFMHRPAALNIPDAPLGHHWQDNTHITFGVATIGIQHENIQIDASIFNGREPDEDRYNIDQPRFDSYSVRLSMNPSDCLAMQISHGFINNPETLEPNQDIRRTTAAIIYNKLRQSGSFWTNSLVWGMNDPNHGVNQHSVLFESNLQLRQYSFFTRLEFVEKSPEELGLISLKERKFSINSWMVGTTRKIFSTRNLDMRLGALATLNIVEDALRPFYGNLPVSAEMFLQVTPGLVSPGPEHKIHDTEM